MDFERIKSHFTLSSHGGTEGQMDGHTHNYSPYVAAGLQMIPSAISKNGIHQRMRAHPHGAHCKECASGMMAKIRFFTLRLFYMERQILLTFPLG